MATALIGPSAITLREFSLLFSKLALQCRDRDADEATIRAYHEALGRFPAEAVRMAGERLSREPGRKWLPTTGEWTEAILAAQTALLREALPSARHDPWRVECVHCEDTGWRLEDGHGLFCPGDRTCGRERKHQAHTYTEACACRATNRTYQRNTNFGKGE